MEKPKAVEPSAPTSAAERATETLATVGTACSACCRTAALRFAPVAGSTAKMGAEVAPRSESVKEPDGASGAERALMLSVST